MLRRSPADTDITETPALQDAALPGDSAPSLDDADASASPVAKDKPHYHGHRERLRERFVQNQDGLPDYEVLELLLFSAIPRKDVKPLAKDLIAQFGSLGAVLSAPIDQLTRQNGVSQNTAVFLRAVRTAGLHLTREEVLDRPVITAWRQLLDYCHALMAREPREQFRILFLDKKNRLIADEVQQEGTVDHTPAYPREIVKRALEIGSTALILVHNHPSGDPEPSQADKDMTRQIVDAARPLGIVVHDHVIISRAGHSSFRSLGLL
ncbi:MAG: DNA repair protein RadC [Alphaproteobacteria bacterium]|nr:DNA repair protein RadC [Alphaproteobacteria bacterium SS10]